MVVVFSIGNNYIDKINTEITTISKLNIPNLNAALCVDNKLIIFTYSGYMVYDFNFNILKSLSTISGFSHASGIASVAYADGKLWVSSNAFYHLTFTTATNTLGSPTTHGGSGGDEGTRAMNIDDNIIYNHDYDGYNYIWKYRLNLASAGNISKQTGIRKQIAFYGIYIYGFYNDCIYRYKYKNPDGSLISPVYDNYVVNIYYSVYYMIIYGSKLYISGAATLKIYNINEDFTITLFKTYDTTDYSGGLYNILFFPTSPLCVTGDTVIDCVTHSKEIKDLRTGDIVNTLTSKSQIIKEIFQQQTSEYIVKLPKIIFSLDKDLYISKDHTVIFNKIPIKAKHLMNTDEIKCDSTTLYNIKLDGDKKDYVKANGLWIETM